MFEQVLRNGKISVFCPGGAQQGTPAALALERMQERWRTEAMGVNWSAAGKQNGNSGSIVENEHF